jgi:hypothetical protein
MAKNKWTTRQTKIYKTQHRKLRSSIRALLNTELGGNPFFNDNTNIDYIEFTLQETFGDINGVIIILKS